MTENYEDIFSNNYRSTSNIQMIICVLFRSSIYFHNNENKLISHSTGRPPEFIYCQLLTSVPAVALLTIAGPRITGNATSTCNTSH